MKKNITESMVREVVKQWQPSAGLSLVEPLTPDASFRRYFRVFLSAAPCATAVLMVFDSVQVPEHSGGAFVPADQSYVELTRFFSENGLAVPKIYADAREQAMLLIEDFGDVTLARVTAEQGPEIVAPLFEQAIDQLLLLQSIPERADFFAYERSFSAEQYYREMGEFRDYILKPRGAVESLLKRSEVFFRSLAAELEAMPSVLVHRDYHCWNLLVHPAEDMQSARVRIIDFQDALKATRSYDLVGLLNDRDTDSLLGEKQYVRLLKYFRTKASRGPNFLDEYDRTLLQRDLKVAGRFCKLADERGLEQYRRWVPGTVRRIGRTLARLAKRNVGDTSVLLGELSALLPEIQAGAATPWAIEEAFND